MARFLAGCDLVLTHDHVYKIMNKTLVFTMIHLSILIEYVATRITNPNTHTDTDRHTDTQTQTYTHTHTHYNRVVRICRIHYRPLKTFPKILIKC